MPDFAFGLIIGGSIGIGIGLALAEFLRPPSADGRDLVRR
jgi:hypothetical protein